MKAQINNDMEQNKGLIKIIDNSTQRQDDIPSKIKFLHKELSYDDMLSNEKNNIDKEVSKHKKEEWIIKTKNLNEFKLSMMVSNKKNDEIPRILSYNELVSTNGNLIRIIGNTRNLISGKIKNCMENLLQNKILDKNDAYAQQ